MCDGDKDTTYFNHKASQRKRRNTIVKLPDSEGGWSSNELEIGKIISSYFTKIFSTSLPSTFDVACAGIDVVVPSTANVELMAEPTMMKIKEALFQMHPNKAPDVDVMHTLFY